MMKWLVFFFLSFILVACQSTPSSDSSSTQQLPSIETIEQQEIEILQAQTTTPQLPIEDPITNRLLAQGQQALQDNNLLTPKESNANMYFQAVLGRDPDNKAAKQGLKDIVARYTKWAIASTGRGQHAKAKKYMDSAALVNPDDPQLPIAKQRIAELRKRKPSRKVGFDGNKYYLPTNLLKSNDEVVLRHLQPIIDRVEQNQSRITIYWPNDKGARFLYQIINSRIDSFRVRGMIHLRKDHMIEIEAN